MKFYADLYEKFKAASVPGYTYAAPDKDGSEDSGPAVFSVGQGLELAFKSASNAREYGEKVLTPIITKLVRTQDINTLRMASVSDRMIVKRNEQTPFLNFLESQEAGVGTSRDFQYQFDEWDIGTDEAELVDIQASLPGEAKSSRPRRSNTIGCFGNKLVFSDLVLDMAQQQANIDLLAREVDLEVTRIRRKMNAILLSNTEVKLEGPAPIPQPGGIITRSTSYALALGGADLTRTVLQGRIDAIANNAAQNGRGYRQLIAFCNARQLQVVRDIIINEYNGIFPTDRLAFEAALMQRMRDFRVPVQTLFDALPGMPVPFVLESQLPANTVLLCEADLPRLVKLNMGGVPGPYVVTRPTENLQRLEVVIDFATLEDPVVESRSVITGVN
jgi:hypothetical protein